MDQVKLITALPQTTSLGLPHEWKLVNQVGVIALFAWQVLLMASYFGVPMVLLTMSFRDMPKYFPQLSGWGLYPNPNIIKLIDYF